MGKLYLLLIVLIPILSMYTIIIAKMTMPGPVVMILFGIFIFSFANLNFSKAKQ
jgi:hypothetical protein